METVRWAKDRRYIKYFFLLSLSYDTLYVTCNVIFLFLFTCMAIPFKVITCCFAFFFQPLSSMPSAKSTQSKTDASSSSSNSSNPSNTVPLRPASAQKTPTNHSFILSRSSTQTIVTSTSSPPMKFNPVVVSWFYYSLFFNSSVVTQSGSVSFCTTYKMNLWPC